jgi:hypothetical protein
MGRRVYLYTRIQRRRVVYARGAHVHDSAEGSRVTFPLL